MDIYTGNSIFTLPIDNVDTIPSIIEAFIDHVQCINIYKHTPYENNSYMNEDQPQNVVGSCYPFFLSLCLLPYDIVQNCHSQGRRRKRGCNHWKPKKYKNH